MQSFKKYYVTDVTKYQVIQLIQDIRPPPQMGLTQNLFRGCVCKQCLWGKCLKEVCNYRAVTISQLRLDMASQKYLLQSQLYYKLPQYSKYCQYSKEKKSMYCEYIILFSCHYRLSNSAESPWENSCSRKPSNHWCMTFTQPEMEERFDHKQ